MQMSVRCECYNLPICMCSVLSDQTHPLAGKVISQSESVTKYEITELQNQPTSNSAHVSYCTLYKQGMYVVLLETQSPAVFIVPVCMSRE